MAIPLGTENKRQVYIVIGLFAAILIGGIYELYGYFGESSGPPTPPRPVANQATPPPARRNTAASGQISVGPDAEKIAGMGIDPTVHFDRLAQSEDVVYAGTGRNIFSAESAPMPVPEAPIKGPRNTDVANVNLPPPPPRRQPRQSST